MKKKHILIIIGFIAGVYFFYGPEAFQKVKEAKDSAAIEEEAQLEAEALENIPDESD